ncbi:L-fucose isomerase-like protein [Tepidanaerobacter acetatoxydans Re1]|uniref:L-fucose isomerase-like protein n=1 Tax=Tepidanaerobacter acetatoxydans (strain DSM 21804 / JCM 16047 / Re1) TaxID=1209989 RepID=F4LQX0_TEPAE|nr:fucose isomerase [Tepidanaerobacter acetatoxydans]AEE92123.1 L-fucose isomerase-like protein [Tepidanaerobacter acetatoxydans Re1]CCP26973.1 L-fucose isomerase-like protein [Tepidanaerobacter acetatoxydans Re1]
MNINVIQLMSPLHGEENVINSLRPSMNFLEDNFDVNYNSQENSDGITVVWVMTGGVEGKFKEIYPWLKKPIILLAEDINNSLPAALEIMAYVRKQQEKAYILHGGFDEIKQEIEKLYFLQEAAKKIKDARIASIGGPSDWLIASHVDFHKVSEIWGSNFVYIPMEDLLKSISEIEIASQDDYFSKAAAAIGIQETDVQAADRIYRGLKKLVQEKNITALTLKCFDLLDPLKNTGCLPLARLNDEGIIAGCEGDMPSLFTMLLVYILTGKRSFMANPSKIDKKANTILLAHCTVPTSIVEEYSLKTHFESGIGVAVAGKFAEQPVTVVKLGGRALDKLYIAEGAIVSNTYDEHRCRTQIKVQMEYGLDSLLKNPLGNHLIIVPGKIETLFRGFMDYMEIIY